MLSAEVQSSSNELKHYSNLAESFDKIASPLIGKMGANSNRAFELGWLGQSDIYPDLRFINLCAGYLIPGFNSVTTGRNGERLLMIISPTKTDLLYLRVKGSFRGIDFALKFDFQTGFEKGIETETEIKLATTEIIKSLMGTFEDPNVRNPDNLKLL